MEFYILARPAILKIDLSQINYPGNSKMYGQRREETDQGKNEATPRPPESDASRATPVMISADASTMAICSAADANS